MSSTMSFTTFGYLSVIWTIIPSFEMGWHISALNVIQAVVTCKEGGVPDNNDRVVSPCIPMSDAAFSTVTSVFTLGGLIGSLAASYIVNRYGRKGALCMSTALYAVGGSLMSTTGQVLGFAMGRVLCGMGAGLGLCVVPIMLAEIAPAHMRGSVGVLNQVAIVFGILSTQSLGINYNAPFEWRMVLSVATVLAMIHMLLGWVMVESPINLKNQGRRDQALRAASRIWRDGMPEGEDNDPLLAENAPNLEEGVGRGLPDAEGLLDVIGERSYRKPLITVMIIMAAQQISGINAVMYYSTDILSKIMANSAAWISLMITIVNVVMTFPAISLIERWGRRSLLSLSAFGVLASLILVGLGIDFEIKLLASAAILGFVASFAIGLGPVPYVVISDIAPNRTVGAMSTIGLSLNWIVNGFVALTFLPLRNYLSGGAENKEGRVFYLFAVVFAVTFFVFTRYYKHFH